MPGDEAPGLLLVTEVAPYEIDGHAVPAGAHHSLPSARTAVRELAELCGLSYGECTSVRALPNPHLESTRIVVLLTIGNTPWTSRQRATILRRVTDGSLGILGLHCSSDASHDWPEYGQLLGARFQQHPITVALPIAVTDASHPSTDHLPPLWRFLDEMYLFSQFHADNHVVLAIQPGPDPSYPSTFTPPAVDIPIAWTRSIGEGHVFYTALGHFATAWENRDYLLHVLGALRSLLG